MKILIADDDALSRRLLERTLLRAGYEVVSAVNGRQAVENLIGPDTPRLALLDWMMPELCSLRANPKKTSSPVRSPALTIT